jgi:hypothetical protein
MAWRGQQQQADWELKEGLRGRLMAQTVGVWSNEGLFGDDGVGIDGLLR